MTGYDVKSKAENNIQRKHSRLSYISNLYHANILLNRFGCRRLTECNKHISFRSVANTNQTLHTTYYCICGQHSNVEIPRLAFKTMRTHLRGRPGLPVPREWDGGWSRFQHYQKKIPSFEKSFICAKIANIWTKFGISTRYYREIRFVEVPISSGRVVVEELSTSILELAEALESDIEVNIYQHTRSLSTESDIDLHCVAQLVISTSLKLYRVKNHKCV